MADSGPLAKDDSAEVTLSELPAKPVSESAENPAGAEPMVSDSKDVEKGISKALRLTHALKLRNRVIFGIKYFMNYAALIVRVRNAVD